VGEEARMAAAGTAPVGPKRSKLWFVEQSTCMAAVSAIVVALAAIAVASGRGLYADGSYYLVRILEGRTFFAFTPYRTYADHLTQAPVVLAVKLGVRNMHSLIVLHSLGLFAFPAAAWLVAFYRLRNDRLFWPFVLLFAIVYLNLSVMAICDCNLAYALVGCSLALLLATSRFSVPDALLLLGISLALTRMYETMVFLGPLLCLLCAVRLREAPAGSFSLGWSSISGPVIGASLAIAALLFLVSTGIAAWSVTHFQQQANLADARNYSGLLDNRQLLLSFVVGLAYSFLIVPSRTAVINAICGLAGFAAALALTLHGNHAYPSQYNAARAWIGVFLFVFAALLARTRFLSKGQARLPRSTHLELAGIPLSLLLVLGLIDVEHSRRFADFLACFRSEVNARTGLVRLADTKLAGVGCGPYGWVWTNPVMSILLRQDASGAIILNAVGGYQPFDPQVSVPDLSRYY